MNPLPRTAPDSRGSRSSGYRLRGHESRGRWTMAVAGAAAATVVLTACGGADQEYPDGDIEFIIPFNPGGGTDLAGREFAEQLGEELGASTTPLNVPGGDESIGLTQLMDSEPDGYTLGIGTSGGSIAQPLVNSDVSYDGYEDFTVFARMTASPYGLFVAPDSGYETLEDLLDEARENPGDVRIASGTSMGNQALSIFSLEDQADVELSLVTTSGGSGEAALEVASGRVDAMIGNAAGQMAMVEAGELHAVAYTGSVDYSAEMPGVESFEEAGYDIPFTSDFMAVGPASLPEDVESRLSDAVEQVVSGEAWQEWGEQQDVVTEYLVGEDLEAYLGEITESIEHAIELSESRS